MEDDLVTSLTRQVKEEVIENYLLERRLIDLQIEHLNMQADETRRQAWMVERRLARLSFLMIHSDMQRRLREMLGMGAGFWDACLNVTFTRKVPLIRVRALTQKRKFRKLLLESYSRLHYWMEKYKAALRRPRKRALSRQQEHRFLPEEFRPSFDTQFSQEPGHARDRKKKILGDNFTAKEMAELDKNLYIRPVSMEKLDVPAPLDIPEPGSIQGKLSNLAEEIFQRYGEEVKKDPEINVPALLKSQSQIPTAVVYIRYGNLSVTLESQTPALRALNRFRFDAPAVSVYLSSLRFWCICS